MNEIQYLRKMIQMYQNPKSNSDFIVAQKHLNKVHRQYGTIEISTIQNLIR